MNEDLSTRDWNLLVDSIYLLNTLDDLALFRKKCLSCLSTMIPCRQATFFQLDYTSEQTVATAVEVHGQEASHLDVFLEKYLEDVFFGGLFLKTHAWAARDSDLYTEEERMGSPVYRDIYEPEGIYHALRIRLLHKECNIGDISMFNARSQADFSDRDVQIGSLMAPHLSLKLASFLARDHEGRTKGEAHLPEKTADAYGLTIRERQVLELVMSGEPEKEIASRLYISLATVKKHIYNIYTKMDVSNRTQLLKRASG